MILYLLTVAIFLAVTAWLLIALHIRTQQLADSQQREQVLSHALGEALSATNLDLLDQKVAVLREGWIRETAQHITDAYAEGYQAGYERRRVAVGEWRRVH